MQSRSWLSDEIGGTIWWGPHAAHGTAYVPFPVALTNTKLPDAYTRGYGGVFDRSTAYWAHRYCLNVAGIRYNEAIKLIKSAQNAVEAAGLALQRSVDGETGKGNVDYNRITMKYSQHADSVVSKWWKLTDYIVWKLADGLVCLFIILIYIYIECVPVLCFTCELFHARSMRSRTQMAVLSILLQDIHCGGWKKLVMNMVHLLHHSKQHHEYTT